MEKTRLYPSQILVLLVFSSLLFLPQSKPEEIHCSRERSRSAWRIIEDYLMPFAEKERYTLSTKCRLHPSNDIFRDQENNKVHVDINEWKCKYCKKAFRAEKFIDQHFDNRHQDLLNSTSGRCLADLCGALHCDFVLGSESRKSKCNPAAVSRNRHLCEELADSCFPISEGPAATRLHEFFLRQFCDAHTCSGKKPFSRGGRKRSSVFYLASSVLILMFLPIFYLIVYLYQREMKTGKIQLKRVVKPGRKAKPS